MMVAMSDPGGRVPPLGLLLLTLGEPTLPSAACRAEIGRRLASAGVDVDLAALSAWREASGAPADEDATPDLRDGEVGVVPGACRIVASRSPRVVALWVDPEQIVVGHRLLTALRASLPAETRTVLVGPGVAQLLQPGTTDRRALSDAVAQVEAYLTGDPVSGLEALVRDTFRIESKPWTVPGLIWVDDGALRTRPGRRSPR